MLRQLKTVIIVNFLLILFFVSVNYGIWNEFSSHIEALGFTRMGPVWIEHTLSGAFFNGNWVGIGGTVMMLNWPFWLFFISTAVNLYFIVRLSKRNVDKKEQSSSSNLDEENS